MEQNNERSIWLINENTIKNSSFLDFNTDSKYIKVAEVFLQDAIIDKILGSCLTKRLNDAICVTGDLDSEPVLKELIDKYILDIFIWGIPLVINTPVSFKTTNAGVVQSAGDTFTSTSTDDINKIDGYYKSKLAFYTKRLVDYLMANRLNIDCDMPCVCMCHKGNSFSQHQYGLNKAQLADFYYNAVYPSLI